jgi:hypothetical protein
MDQFSSNKVSRKTKISDCVMHFASSRHDFGELPNELLPYEFALRISVLSILI